MRFCNSLVGFSRQSASKALSHCVEISKVVAKFGRAGQGISFSRYGTSSARESFWTAEASRSSSAAYLDGVSVDSVGTLASRGVVAAGVSATQAIDDKNSTTRTLRHSTIVPPRLALALEFRQVGCRAPTSCAEDQKASLLTLWS